MGIDPARSQPGTTSQGLPAEEGLARQLSEFARAFQAERGVTQTLEHIVKGATASIAGADFAGITLVTRGGTVSTPAASDLVVEAIDRVQYEVRQGPCLSSAWDQATIRADDLRSEVRWPLFAPRATGLGVLSMMCFQLFVHQEDLGALNLYSRRAGAFDAESENDGLLFASHAAIAMVGAQREDSLAKALANRDIIGQAKGILMERHKVSAEVAFALLARASQHTNRKLLDVATAVATTGLEPRDAVTQRWQKGPVGADDGPQGG